ncbi:MAG: hypothetical protein C7B43_16270 [Sulfobacillus benefaciens]|uniref:Uncharacterized protein n=1 Tax=Sulfobacillus benefaciens TaxID=453960 RepID=A0A2T2WTY1_9FIRM|nr:MAG: hypothetical protein C7B43_16270 [Sulfobacillus benefaciens]
MDIEATILTLASPTGIDYSDIHEENVRPHWMPDMPCRYFDCDHTAQVKDFIIPNPQWYEQ